MTKCYYTHLKWQNREPILYMLNNLTSFFPWKPKTYYKQLDLILYKSENDDYALKSEIWELDSILSLKIEEFYEINNSEFMLLFML